MPALPLIALAVTGVGAGLQYSAQMSAARTAEQFSMLNAQAGIQQAEQQGALAAIQSQLQAATAQTQARAAAETAMSEREQAELDAKMGVENIRRGRDEFLRELAAANAQAGGSGAVLATGSPLEVLMAAADTEQQMEQDSLYSVNAGRVAGFRKAAGTALQGRVSGMNSSLYQIEALASVAEARFAASQARLGGLAGAAQATGMRRAAFGGLISGIGSAAGSFVKSSANAWGRPKSSAYTPRRY